MKETSIKSTITCDLEGRIDTFNEGAEQIFGYTAEEVIGHKRVSLFSPGLIVLEHVPSWLKIASEKGEFKSRTVFLRKDGTPFAADIRITPTFRDGQQIGYCGVTTPLPDVDPAQATPEISLSTKILSWLVITRMPFLTASIVPVLIGAVWVGVNKPASPFPWMLFFLTMFGAAALHVAANTFNDYFDWSSGTDKINNNYFLPYSGGSRSMELGLISEKGMLKVGMASLGIASIFGLAVMALSKQPLLMLFGLAGAFSGYFYTAPPLRLVARKGLGELLIGLNFGPLMTAGTVLALTGTVMWVDFAIGLPIGLLTTAILWINQFPDEISDRESGKHNLVVVLGKTRARWGFVALMIAAFGIVATAVMSGVFPASTLAMFGALPLAVSASRILFEHYADRELVAANAKTINLQLIAGILFAIGVAINPLVMK
ncbi:MAG TPA: UbiA family prenyltransferase [Anaerolineales bacterium]|nr:UbiA family prenyltransferase [Anaerolineales bacterium]